MREIFKNNILKYCTTLQKKFFFSEKAFLQHVTVWFVRMRTYKNADYNIITFHRKKKRTKMDKSERKAVTVKIHLE